MVCASRMMPTISEDGNGQGWQNKYSADAGSALMPASSSSSRAAACSRVSPGSTNPASADQNPAGQLAWRPSKHLSSFTASIIATGSVRGKCSAPHEGQTRFHPASVTSLLPPHLAQNGWLRCHSNRLRAVDARLASIALSPRAAARMSVKSPDPWSKDPSSLNPGSISIAKIGAPSLSSPRKICSPCGVICATSGPSQTRF